MGSANYLIIKEPSKAEKYVEYYKKEYDNAFINWQEYDLRDKKQLKP